MNSCSQSGIIGWASDNEPFLPSPVLIRAVFDIDFKPLYICNDYATWDIWCVESPGWPVQLERDEYEVEKIMES